MKGASFRISIQFHVDALYLQAAPRLCLTKLPNGHAFKEQFIDFLQSFTTAFGDTEKGENNGHESRNAEYEANPGPERRVRLIYEIGDCRILATTYYRIGYAQLSCCCIDLCCMVCALDLALGCYGSREG